MNTAPLQRLHEAASDGDINKFKQLLEEDSTLLDRFVDAPDAEATDNPLHTAASHGHVDFTCEVLRLKPQLAEKPNGEGCLPLHMAAARGHLQVVEKLADRADQVNRKIYLFRESKYGYTPLHMAAINGKHDVVQMLVQKCKEALDITTVNNETVLHLAVKANCLDSVCYCINQEISINEKDIDGDTCLHFACQRRNQHVITQLLGQESIEVNCINSRGLTPLDVLLVSSWGSSTDVSLVNILRRAGGEEAREQSNPRSNIRNSVRTFPSPYNNEANTKKDAQTLLLVATLVATMTITAISNPPGGFVQDPFDKGDAYNSTSYIPLFSWHNPPYPVGRPTLLVPLQPFFYLDSVALFLSIFVILFLLCGSPQKEIEMKLLAGIVGLAAFIAAFAFTYAFAVVCVPSSFGIFATFIITWSIVFVSLGLWGSIRLIMFIWKKGGFKGNILKWILFILCFLGLVSSAFLLVVWVS